MSAEVTGADRGNADNAVNSDVGGGRATGVVETPYETELTEAVTAARGGDAPAARWRAGLPSIAAWAIFALMVMYGELKYGQIVQSSTISNLFINNAHMLIICVGLTLVIVTGGIDLSVGAVIAVSSVAGVILTHHGWNPYVVIAVMVLIGAAFGLASGVLVEFVGMQPFIATLTMMFLARGIASTLSTESERLDPDSPIRELAHNFKLHDGEKVNDLVVTPGVLIAFATIATGLFVARRTRFGRTIYAIGGSESAAQLMGLRVRRTRLAAYVLSGTLSAVAGVVYTARIGNAQNITGIGWELTAIAAVVIGGTVLTGGHGSIAGSVVGVLVLGMMTVLITRDGGIRPEWTTIITGSILFAFVLLQRAVTGSSR